MDSSNITEPLWMTPAQAGRVSPLWLWNLILVVLFVLSITSAVAVRSYVIYSARLRWQTEDWCCLAALFLSFIYAAPSVAMIYGGAGFHAWEIQPAIYTIFKKALYVSNILYSPAAFTTKATLLLLIAKAYASKPRVAKAVRTFIALLALILLPILICKIIICLPIAAFWAPDANHSGKCLNQGTLYVFDTTAAIISDFIILVLPMPLMWTLAVPVEQKLRISILFGAGGVALGLTAYRLYRSLVDITLGDLTMEMPPVILLTHGEIAIGMLYACLPSVSILFKRSKDRMKQQWPSSFGAGRRRSGRRSNNSTTSESQRIGSGGSRSSSKDNIKPSSGRFWSNLVSHRETNISSTIKIEQNAPHQPNVDVLLGVITEMEGDEEMDVTRGQGFSGKARILSIDGHREGWLSPVARSATGFSELERIGDPEASIQPAGTGGWDCIWDGTRNEMTDTLMEQLTRQKYTDPC